MISFEPAAQTNFVRPDGILAERKVFICLDKLSILVLPLLSFKQEAVSEHEAKPKFGLAWHKSTSIANLGS